MGKQKIIYDVGFNVDSSALQQVRQELTALGRMGLQEFKLINPDGTKAQLKEVQQAVKTASDAIETSFNPKLNTINIEKFNQSLRNIKVAELEQKFAILGKTGSTAFRNFTSEVLTSQRELLQTSSVLDKMGETLANTIRWSVTSAAVNTVTGSVQKAWSYAQKLDNSLNDIRIVTDKSADSMEKFAKQANKAAKALGAATTDYTQASLIYYQQGLSEKDVEARTEATIKAANVTGQSTAEVSEQLTAVWNGYKVASDEAELYVDKLAAVAATTAADLEELSDGMTKVASAANTMGVDIDQLSAQLATIVSVTREDASAVGTSLKTIYARMGDLSVDGVDEFGVSLGDVSSQMRQMGIEVLDQQGNLRDMGEVIEEVAKKWGTWTSAQQQAAAVAMAGKRQYNNLIALFENWDMYESALTTSQTSAGTLQKQQDIYMDSLAAHLEQLGTAGEKVYDALFDSESMKDFLDILTIIVEQVGDFINAMGGGGNLLLGLGSAATQLFSKDIARGISLALHNFGLLREYQSQYRAELEIQEKFQGVNDEAVKSMVSLKQQELKYSKLLTEEQKQQFEYYIKQTAELANQKDSLQQTREELEQYYQETTGSSQALKLDGKQPNGFATNPTAAANKLEGIAIDIESQAEEAGWERRLNTQEAAKAEIAQQKIYASDEGQNLFGKNTEQLKNLMPSEDLQKTDEQAKALAETIENLITTQQKYSNQCDQTAEILEEMYEVHALTTEEYKSYITALTKAKKEGKGLYDIEKKLQSVTKNKPKELRNRAEAISNLTSDMDDLNKKEEDSKKSQESFIKGIKTTAAIQEITKLVGAIGGIATAWNMLKNLGSIIDDESLSGVEKATQVFQTLTTVGGIAVATFKSVKNAIWGLIVALGLESTALGVSIAISKAKTMEEKKQLLSKYLLNQGIQEEVKLEGQNAASIFLSILAKKLKTTTETAETGAVTAHTAATWLDTVAQWAANHALGAMALIILIVIAAIALLIAAIYGIVKGVQALINWFKEANDNGKKAFEETTKAAQAATEEFNRVKQAYDDLKQSLEDYNEAQAAIAELTTGTDEWREAIREVNQQVIELMNDYPILAQYIDNVAGQLTISAAGQEAALDSMSRSADIASNVALSANNQKLMAKNNMVSKQGANQIFDTSSTRAWGKGLSFGYSVVAPLLGLPAGGAGIPYLINHIFDSVADKQEEAYDYAVNAAAIDETILASKEVFKEAMKEAGYEKYANAIWAEREQLLNNSAAVAANTAAVNTQSKLIAQQALSGKDDNYDSSTADEKNAIETIYAAKVSKITDKDTKYIDKMRDYYGTENYREAYAQMMGIDYVSATYDSDKKIYIYEDAAGNKTEVTYATARTALAQEGYRREWEEKQQTQAILNMIEQTKTREQARGRSGLLSAFIGGEERVDLTSGTQTEIQQLQNLLTYYDSNGADGLGNALGLHDKHGLLNYVQEAGFENIDAFVDSMRNSVAAYNDEKAKLTIGMNDRVRFAYAQVQDTIKEYSLSTQKNMANGLKAAFEKGGQAGLEAFRDLVNSGEYTAAELEQIGSAISGLDWSATTNIIDLTNALSDCGIEVNENSTAWINFVSVLEKATNVVSSIRSNFGALRETLDAIASIIDSLNIGDIVEDTDYATLIRYNPELEKYFVTTASGHMYIGGGKEQLTKAQNTVLDVERIRSQFETAKQQGENFANKVSGLYYDEDTKSYGFGGGAVSTQAFINSLPSLISNPQYADYFSAIGINEDQFREASRVLNHQTTVTIGGKKLTATSVANMDNIDQLAKELGYADAAQYATKRGLTTNEGAKELKQAIDDAQALVGGAQETVSNAKSAIVGSLNSMKDGTWEKQSREAQVVAVSARVKNYEQLRVLDQTYQEATGYSILTTEELNKLALGLLAQEAESLGINASIWEAYATSIKDVTKQAALLSNITNEQLLEEVDAWVYLERAIDNVDQALEKLEELQERGFGLEVIQNLKAQIEAYKAQYDMQSALYRKQAEQQALTRSNLSTKYDSYLQGLGLPAIYFGPNDTFVLESVWNSIYNKMLATNDAEERAALQGILDEIQDYNESVSDRLVNEEEALRERNNAILDAQIEAYEQEIDMWREYRSLVKEWGKTNRDFKRYTELGIDAFGEVSAASTLISLGAQFNDITNTWGGNEPDSFAQLRQFNTWANGGDKENNPYNFEDITDRAAFMEKYQEVFENAQEDVQELIDLGQEMFDAWTEALNEISELYEQQIERLSTVSSLLESSASLSQLFGQKTTQYYAQMRKNAADTLALQEEQVKNLTEEYNNFFDEEGNLKNPKDAERAKAVWEALANAEASRLEAIQSLYDAVAAEFEAKLQESIDEMFNGSLDKVSELWNLEKTVDEMYFDDVNAEYEKSKFARTVQSSIDSTDNIVAQNKLKQVLQQQLEILEKKDKLSQYDLDRANAMYELTLKQIALEEAQQTTSKMKLTRDAMGNYTYQYVADQDKIAKAEEELAAAENNLYNLQKEHQASLIDSLISRVQEYQKLQIQYLGDDEMLQKINDKYSLIFAGLREDMEYMGLDISDLSELLGTDMSTPWMDTFNSLADIDPAQLLQSTADLLAEGGGLFDALNGAKEAVSDLFELEKTTANRLQAYANDTSELNKRIPDLKSAMADANTVITNVVTNLGTLVTNLDTYANKYTDYYKQLLGNEGDNEPSEDSPIAIIQKSVEKLTKALNQDGTTIAISTRQPLEWTIKDYPNSNEDGGQETDIVGEINTVGSSELHGSGTPGGGSKFSIRNTYITG